MKIRIGVIFVFIVIVAYAAFSAKREFAPAEDLPREAALVYAEFADLPALIELWEKSELKQKYLESENFNSLKQRRLALKLASRWREFGEAIGFPLDLEIVGALAEKRAAIGIYDIGKLEFVFIAPISGEVFTATAFFQNKERFEEKLLENGASVFSTNIAADSGRQSQKLLFTHLKGRLVLATSEKLLLQTVNNINDKSNKNRLTDEPSFKELAERSNRNFLFSVWVNQTALNKDYYFKRYWLMPDADELKNIRAGIFDVSLEEKKIIERRKFLLEKETTAAKLSPAETREMLSFIPTDVSFYRVRTANAKTSAGAVFDCLFERKIQTAKTEPRNYFPNYSFYDFDDSAMGNYEYLGREFDETIDETPEDNSKESNVVEDKIQQSNLQNILQLAKPQSVLALAEPVNLPVPLFAEFRRAVVVKTKAPVNQIQLETAIGQATQSRVSLLASDVNLTWRAAGENRKSWRELNLPMLGWEICYAQSGENLIVSNSSNLLKEILARSDNASVEKIPVSSIDSLTVIDLKNKEENFHAIFGKLAGENSDDFFLGNVGSLLESALQVKTIEIEKSGDLKYREEKITLNLE